MKGCTPCMARVGAAAVGMAVLFGRYLSFANATDAASPAANPTRCAGRMLPPLAGVWTLIMLTGLTPITPATALPLAPVGMSPLIPRLAILLTTGMLFLKVEGEGAVMLSRAAVAAAIAAAAADTAPCDIMIGWPFDITHTGGPWVITPGTMPMGLSSCA